MSDLDENAWPNHHPLLCIIMVMVVPGFFLMGQMAGWFDLTWPFVTLILVFVSPFFLPLLRRYIRKVHGLEFNEGLAGPVAKTPPDPPKDGPIAVNVPPTSPDGGLAAEPAKPSGPPPSTAPPQPAQLAPPAAGADPDTVSLTTGILIWPSLPNFDALTPAEQRIIRTFDRAKQKHAVDLSSWGFRISQANPLYREYILGASDLVQRGLVQIFANGLLGLTDRGRFYMRFAELQITCPGSAWTEFAPAGLF